MNKVVILARLAFDRWIDPPAVGRRPPTVLGTGAPGITGVTDGELAAAASSGLAIKLLASAQRTADGIVAGVLPTAVRAGSPFGLTSGVLNRVEIDADPLGTVGLSGPGAGGAATSSAVLGDLVAVARGLSSTWAGRSAASGATGAVADPSSEARDWFAFVARPRDEADRAAPVENRAQTVTSGSGLAIRVTDVSLDEARAAVRGWLRAGADATLYPVAD